MEQAALGSMITVVGASGVGKDSLLQGARNLLPDCCFIKRVITRPADSGAEDHTAVTNSEFNGYKERGALLFDWQAHGLCYGIPIEARQLYLQGHTVIFNGSRNALATQQARWADLRVVWVTASPATRAKRLTLRGREDEASIAKRLTREALDIPPNAVIVENEASLEDGIRAMVLAIRSLAAFRDRASSQ